MNTPPKRLAWGIVTGCIVTTTATITTTLDLILMMAPPDAINLITDPITGLMPMLAANMVAIIFALGACRAVGLKLDTKVSLASACDQVIDTEILSEDTARAITGIFIPPLILLATSLFIDHPDSFYERASKWSSSVALIPITAMTILQFIGWDSRRHAKAKKARIDARYKLIRSIEESTTECPRCKNGQTTCIGIVFQANQFKAQFGNQPPGDLPPNYASIVSVHECTKCHLTLRTPVSTQDNPYMYDP